MNIRTCILIVILLVFNLLHYISAAETENDPVQDAHDEYTIAREAWDLAKTESDKAYVEYNETDKVLIFLRARNADVEYADKDNWEDIRNGALDLIADVLQIASTKGKAVPTSLSSNAVKLIANAKDAVDIRNTKDAVMKALKSETYNVSMLKGDWEVAVKKTADLEEKKVKAFKIWNNLKESQKTLTYKLSANTKNVEGRWHYFQFKTNKVYEWVKWYRKKSNQTGLGELLETDFGIRTSRFAWLYKQLPSDSGDYVFTAKAKIASSGKEVSDSVTVIVLSKGIFFNKTHFTAYESLTVTIRHPDLINANMYIGDSLSTGYADKAYDRDYDGIIVLQKEFTSKDSGYHLPVYITYEYWDQNDWGKTIKETSKYYIYID